jgi:Transmembrane amino acid transporter protein
LQNFTDEKDVLVLIGNIALLIVTSCSFPLIHYPCRGNILTLAFKGSDNNILHVALTVGIVGTAYVIANLGLDLGFVLGIVGSTVGLFLVFVLPAAVFLRLSPAKLTTPKKIFTLMLFVAGWALMVICIYAVLSPQP